MSAVSVDMVSRTMQTLLATESLPVVYHDIAAKSDLPVSLATATSPTGLLPVFIVAGEAVWREATGKGFELDIVRDRDALLGYRLRGIGAGSLTTVMLATMEATAQVVTGSGVVVASDLGALWTAATNRIDQGVVARPPQASAGSAP